MRCSTTWLRVTSCSSTPATSARSAATSTCSSWTWLPRLPASVHVHVHDIIWPFEYARKWVYEGRAWNEAYLLRALLINNERLRVTLWGSQLRHRRLAEMEALWPEWAAVGGTSLWLETTAPDSERP